ncbi:MAG TPA: hypothetical protein VLL52_23605 [Anaerolineae bacterium]|nr:hypothetical protein [Anaerolineae bacterium]
MAGAPTGPVVVDGGGGPEGEDGGGDGEEPAGEGEAGALLVVGDVDEAGGVPSEEETEEEEPATAGEV